MLDKELLVESHRWCADPAGVLNQFQEKMRRRQMNVRLNRRQFHCLRLAAVAETLSRLHFYPSFALYVFYVTIARANGFMP